MCLNYAPDVKEAMFLRMEKLNRDRSPHPYLHPTPTIFPPKRNTLSIKKRVHFRYENDPLFKLINTNLFFLINVKKCDVDAARFN